MLSKIKAFFAKLFSKKLSVQEQVLNDWAAAQPVVQPAIETVPVIAVEEELPDNLKGVSISTITNEASFGETPPAIDIVPKANKKSKSKKKKKSY